MRSTGKVFLLSLGVVAVLLLMHQLPTFSAGDFESRPVCLLSDLLPEAGEEDGLSADTLAPMVPQRKAPVPLYKPEGVVLIEDFSEGKAGGMAGFYDKLLHIRERNERVHIAYFGDSFIESDIVTCDLREAMQAEYGGNGPGWVDCGGGVGTQRPTVSSRFTLLTENVCTKKPFNPKLQALSQRYYYADNGATLRLASTKYREHAGRWSRATLFFMTDTAFSVAVSQNGEAYERTDFAPSGEVQVLETTGVMHNIAYRFPKASRQTRLFGVTLDGDSGVAVDNYSMRGSPGFKLTSVPMSTLKSLARHRSYDMIILQFGLNVVDNNSTDAQCRHYVNRMKEVVSHMKEAFPDAGIVVFSCPDRAQRGPRGIHTVSGIKRLLGFQRNMAAECGVAFFDLHQAMGGDDAIVDFVRKGLAAKDYTHMNYKGGKVIAEHIFQSVKAGVENYRRQTENETEQPYD